MSEQLPPLPLSSSSSSSLPLPLPSPPTTIKHLVISSGGPAGHMMYSVLRTLNIKGIWDMKDIKSIYGSSIGSYIAIILALHYEWEVMDDYLIKRPWEKIFVSSSSSSSSSAAAAAAAASASSIDVNDHLHLSGSSLADAKNKLAHIFQLYNTHGLYGLKEFTETLRPALQGKDMTTKITFQEFYDRTGIEVHFTVTEMNKFQAIDFSYKTHPNQSLVEACYMSCCYPFGFSPIYRDGCCYLDGGIVNDYPLHECIRDQKCGLGEILGVKVLWEKKPTNLTEKASLLQFIYTFFNQINSNFYENRATKAIPNEVVCVSKVFSIRDWMNWVKDENYRRELVLRGETFANVFLSYRRNFKDSEVQADPVPTSTLQPSAAITSLTDLVQEMAAAEATATATAEAEAEATTEEAEATEPTTMM
jgi:predicted acylesterase/phospholipase RssA